MRINKSLYSVLSIFLLGAILTNSILLAPINLKANFDPIQQEAKESIVILVDQELMQSDESLVGLSELYSSLNQSKLEGRIKRYANDVKSHQAGKDIKVVTVSQYEDPAEIAATLKSQYYNENLTGLVVIGDVPLPVVNKAGNRFISMYPYTDFEQAAYVLNPQTYYFERNPKNLDYEPEIWHGLIRFHDASQYAEYLDKNHLYYEEEEGFADFEEKIFYASPELESKSLNASLLAGYENAMRYREEIAYNRFTNVLLQRIASNFNNEVEDQLGGHSDMTDAALGDLDSMESQMLKIPDTQTKLMLEKYFKKATDLFSTALGKERAALLGTGRYNSDDYFTPISLVAQKDEYYMQYFWQLNTLLEAEVDKIVDLEQQSITIPNGAELKGEITLNDGSTVRIEPQIFVNNAYKFPDSIANPVLFLTQLTRQMLAPKDTIPSFDLRVNGNKEITNVAQCRLYRGGMLGGSLSKTVEMWRKDFVVPATDSEPEHKICVKKKPTRRGKNDEKEKKCSLFYGKEIKDTVRTKLVTSESTGLANLDHKGLVTHEACFSMRPLDTFMSLVRSKIDLTKKADVEKSDTPINSDSIQLGPLTLAQVLEVLPDYNGDPHDWNAWSSYLLANPIKSSFVVDHPFGEDNDIAKIALQVEVIEKNSGLFGGGDSGLSSVVHHKDPSAAFIKQAIENNNTTHLPIDQIRYVTFIDKHGIKQEIKYPNLFKLNSLEELRQALTDLEQELSSLTGQNYEGRLSSLIQAEQDKFDEEGIDLQQATESTIKSLLDWKDLTLEQKYTDILRTILSVNQNNVIAGVPQDFEIAVISSQSDSDGLNYNLISEEAYGVNSHQFAGAEDLAYESAYTNQEDKEEEAIVSIDGIPFMEWLTEYMPAWFEEVSSLATDNFPPKLDKLVDLPSYQDLIKSDEIVIKSIRFEASSTDVSIENGQNNYLEVEALNKKGQRVIGEPVMFNLNVTGQVALSQTLDNDPDTAGIQLFMASGYKKIPFEPISSGDISFQLTYEDFDLQAQIKAHEYLETVISEITPIQVADTEGTSFTVSRQTPSGQKIMTSKPFVKLDNPYLGSFSSQTEATEATQFEYIFKPSVRAGHVNLNARANGARPATQEIKVLPAEAKQLKFSTSQTSLNTQEVETVDLTVEVLDRYFNKVKDANQQLTVSLSNPSKVKLASSEFTLANGQAEIQVESKLNTFGNTFLKVEAEGLTPAIHKLELGSRLSTADLNVMPFSSLYLELQTPNSGIEGVGQNLLVHGKTQVISTLSTDLKAEAPIMYLHANGALEVIDQTKINTTLNLGEAEIQIKAYDSQQRELASLKADTSGLDYKGILTGNEAILEAGIYLKNYGDLKNTDLESILKINEQGIPIVKDNSYALQISNTSEYFALDLYQANQIVARVIYSFSRAAAVTLRPATHPTIKYASTYTLPSSTSKAGFIFYDPKVLLSEDQLPSSNKLRLEAASLNSTELVGLREGHKSILLFSAGLNAGQANQAYLSEAGIVLGDPLIKLKPTDNFSVSNQLGYDVGEYLGRTSSPIVSIIERDDYLIIAEESGLLSRLNKGDYKLEKGFAKIPSGIKEAKNFGDSIIILTREACVNEDSCLYELDETGQLTQLKLELPSKAVQLFPYDFTGDGDLDLAILTDQKNLRMYLQKDGELLSTGSSIGYTTGQLDFTQNLIDSLWVKANINQSQLATHPYKLTVQNGSESRVYPFNSVISEPFLQSSTLNSTDINGGTLRNGDTVEFTLNLKNSSTSSLNNSYISLALNENYEYQEGSLTEGYNLTKTTDSLRPFIITNLNLEPNQTIQLRYRATYHLTGNEAEALVNIVTDDNEAYPADGLPDFKIVIPNTKSTTYFYSNYDSSTNRLTYIKKEVNLGTTQVDAPQAEVEADAEDPNDQVVSSSLLESQGAENDADGDGIPDVYDGLTRGLNKTADSIEKAIKNGTCDGQGCLAMPHNEAFLVPNHGPGIPVVGWACPSPIGVMFGTAANSCTGGRFYLSPTLTGELAGALCLGPLGTPFPNCFTTRITDLGSICDTINAAVQDLINGAANIIESASGGLFVNVSNEAPGETGVNIQIPGFPAVITNWVTAQLDEIQRNALDMPDITLIYPDVMDLLGDGISMPFTKEDLTNTFGEQDVDEENIDQDTSSEGESPEEESRLDRLRGRINNIAETGERVGDFSAVSIENILAQVNTMPLFNITTQTYTLNYPQLDPAELTKYTTQIKEIWEQNLEEVNRALNAWGCYATPIDESEFLLQLKSGHLNFAASASNECISLGTSILDIGASFSTNIENLKLYRELPQNIFEAENFLAEYANSILGYAEVILDNTAGYLSANRSALKEWETMFESIQGLVDDFSVILDVFINYQESCSSCRSSRSEDGWIGLLTRLSAALPVPPVIPIPKLPNITIDVSQVEANIEIVLPKFEFKPEPFILPDLNGFVIQLPDAPPIDFMINLPKYGLNIISTIPEPPNLSKFMANLPNLPEIQIPNLPTIPEPPQINALEIAGDFMVEVKIALDLLDKLLRIFCLIAQGIIPTNEFMIKSQIESLTARPLDIVLPLDINFGFEFPQINIRYLEEYRIIVETHLNLDFLPLSQFAENISTKFNAFQSNLTTGANNYLQDQADRLNETVSDFNDDINEEAQSRLDNAREGVEGAVNDGVNHLENEASDFVDDLQSSLLDINQKFTKLAAEMQDLDNKIPKNLNLVATTKTIPQPDYKGINLDRDFQIPPAFLKQVETLIAYRDEPVTFGKTTMIADTSSQIKMGVPNRIVSRTFKIAANTGGAGASNKIDFSPNSGIYVYNTETQTSEQIIVYSAESKETIELMNLDLDKDNDDDLLYTRGQEIFLKKNLKNDRPDRGRSSVDFLNFEELNILDTSNIKFIGVTTQSSYNKVYLNLEGLSDQTVIVDVYKSSFEESQKTKRFVVQSNDTDTPWSPSSKIPLSEDYNIKPDGFDEMYFKKGDSSQFNLDLKDQAYLLSIYVFNPLKNELELIVSRQAVTPNICGDESGPTISIEQGKDIEVSVANPINIDASGSSDSQTAIYEVYLDTDLEQDKDRDGDPTNDRDLQGSGENRANTSFRLNPVNETKDFQVALWMIDLAGNASYRIITIHVVAPKIIIDDVESLQVSGHLQPSDDNVPLTLIRMREGVLKEMGNTKTDELGEYEFNDLVKTDKLHIYNASNELLFEISQSTGSIKSLKSTTNIKVKAAVAGQTPTTINFYEDQKLITSMLRVADSNQDVEIMTAKISERDLKSARGVVVVNKSRIDKYKVSAIPGDDPAFAGAAAILKGKQRQAIIDTDGSIILINSNLKLALEKVNSTDKYQWFTISENNKVVAYVFVPGDGQDVQIATTEVIPRNFAANSSGTDSTSSNSGNSATSSNSTFTDIHADDPDKEIFDYLQNFGVIKGINKNGLQYFEPERLLSRAEYASVILKIMCIQPSEEAYLPPQVFEDIPFQHNLAWYYPITKENNLQGFFEGYLGEKNLTSGLSPFKPNNTINRAEAVKVILEALESKGVVDLSTLIKTEVWYTPYINIARNISSIITDPNYSGTNYLISPEASQAPLQNISRREFGRMAYNVLLVDNCLTEDKDGDGLPYYYEVENGLDTNQNDANGDQDGDGHSNLDEYENGGDPNQPADGGIAGINVVTPGIYLTDIDCTSCPCLYRLEFETDIIDKDILIVILRNPETKALLRRSDPVTYKP